MYKLNSGRLFRTALTGKIGVPNHENNHNKYLSCYNVSRINGYISKLFHQLII